MCYMTFSQVLSRLAHEFVQDATPCVVWDAIEMVVEIPSASMNDFMGRGGQTRNLCNKIADAAAVPRAYVSCSASAMGMLVS